MSFTMTMIFNIDQFELVDTGLATGPKRTTPEPTRRNEHQKPLRSSSGLCGSETFKTLGQTRSRIPPRRVILTGFVLFASDGISDADVPNFRVPSVLFGVEHLRSICASIRL